MDGARLAILNGFGRTLGDSIVGLQALTVAVAAGAVPARPVLFRLPGLSAAIQGAYHAAADICEIRTLPWAEETPACTFAGAAAFGRVIDLRDFAFDADFRGVAMIDFFLRRLGVDPALIPAGRRRNTWLAPRLPALPHTDLPEHYVLVCPHAAQPMRCMPAPHHAALLRWLIAMQPRPVVTQGVPTAGALPAQQSRSFAALCALVANAALIVSVDTAMVHLADALSVPCFALFTTHRPEWRVRDYPLCRSLHLPPADLPPSLEFARSPADEAAAIAAWPEFGQVVPALAPFVAAITARASAPPPAAAPPRATRSTAHPE